MNHEYLKLFSPWFCLNPRLIVSEYAPGRLCMQYGYASWNFQELSSSVASGNVAPWSFHLSFPFSHYLGRRFHVSLSLVVKEYLPLAPVFES
jgi:hypothetical protein